jgi:hypothetical protein
MTMEALFPVRQWAKIISLEEFANIKSEKCLIDFDTSKEELYHILLSHIDKKILSKRGTGQADTIEQLYDVLQKKETSLHIVDDNTLYKSSDILCLDLRNQREDGLYKIKEDYVILADGRKIERKLPHSISEKIPLGETWSWYEPIFRAMEQELGAIIWKLTQEQKNDIIAKGSYHTPWMEKIASARFPWITSYVRKQMAEYTIPLTWDVPTNPFIEEEEHKTTYFKQTKIG